MLFDNFKIHMVKGKKCTMIKGLNILNKEHEKKRNRKEKEYRHKARSARRKF